MTCCGWTASLAIYFVTVVVQPNMVPHQEGPQTCLVVFFGHLDHIFLLINTSLDWEVSWEWCMASKVGVKKHARPWLTLPNKGIRTNIREKKQVRNNRWWMPHHENISWSYRLNEQQTNQLKTTAWPEDSSKYGHFSHPAVTVQCFLHIPCPHWVAGSIPPKPPWELVLAKTRFEHTVDRVFGPKLVKNWF